MESERKSTLEMPKEEASIKMKYITVYDFQFINKLISS